MKKLISYFIMLFILMNAHLLYAQWQKTFGPFEGRNYHFAVGNGTIFSDGGIIYRSLDNGMSWTEKSEGIWYWDVTALYFSDNGIFAGLGESDSGLLFYSDDNGETWAQINAINNNNTITGITKINNDMFLSTYRNGLFKSTDGGFNWEALQCNLTDPRCTDLISANETLFLGTIGNGVLKSIDNGITWTSCGNTEINAIVANLSFANNSLYVCFYTWENASAVYRSDDMGNNFNDIGSYVPTPFRRTVYADGNNVYMGTDQGLYRSLDKGVSWQRIGLSHASVISIITFNGNIIAGTDYIGIHTSTDNGTTWINTGFSAWSGIKALTVVDNNLIVSSGYVGVKTSLNNGVYFSSYNNLNQSFVNQLIHEGNSVYAATTPYITNRGGVFTSSDAGISWQFMGLSNRDVLSIAKKDNYIFAGTTYDGAFRTSNNGTTWAQTNSGLANLWVGALSFYGNYIYAGTSSGIYYSTNYGSSWNFGGMDYKWIKSLCENNGKLFALCEDGIYFLDSSNNWNKIELQETNYFQFIKSFESKLFAGVNRTLLMSEDNGLTWQSIFESKEDTFVSDVYANSQYLYCGTSGDGLWKIKLSEVTEIKEQIQHSLSYSLSQNYPNPFNPTTSIEYSVARNEYVSLKVYDILGNEISTLVNEVKSPGSYKVNFNGSNLSSGIYFYKFNAGNYSSINKMILLK